jgi:drug/metabolite transporter (DMT)-like permease
MVLATLCWGASTVANKLALDRTGMRPMSLEAVQLAVSMVVLAAVVAVRRAPQVRLGWRAGWVGLLEPGASYAISLVGLSMTAATHASIIGALEPALVSLGAWWFLRERWSRLAAGLTAISVLGALIVVTDGASSVAGATVIGDLLVVVGVMSAAGYVMLTSRRSPVADAVSAVLAQQAWALLVVVPALVVSVGFGGFGPVARGTDWLYVVVSALLGFVIPFQLYLRAVAQLPPERSSSFLSLIPLTGVVAAATVLREPVTYRAGVGAAVVVISLYLLSTSP